MFEFIARVLLRRLGFSEEEQARIEQATANLTPEGHEALELVKRLPLSERRDHFWRIVALHSRGVKAGAN